MEKFTKSKIEDLKNSEVPESLYWSVDQVCDFFENKLNLPEYKVIIIIIIIILFLFIYNFYNFDSKH
jgi:hypothetical protein